MSFIPQALTRFTDTGTIGRANSVTYTNTSDTLATMSASGYFDPTVNVDNNIAGQLQVNDLIYLVGSDGADWVKVSSLNPITVSTNVESISLPQGNMLIGNASGEAAAVPVSHYIVFASKEADGGGSATIAIPVPGTLVSDLAFAQVEASTNAVTVQKVTPTVDTVTVILSGDPGVNTLITWQVLRPTM